MSHFNTLPTPPMTSEEETLTSLQSSNPSDSMSSSLSNLTIQPNPLSLEERIQLALSVSEECISEDGLRQLFTNKPTAPICYDGFEPSGRMHIAQGIQKSINVNKLTRSGCHFVFWVADWFAQLNNKMNGDLKKIQVVGNYFIEVWKACGMDMTHVEFKWASEEINKNPEKYWTLVMDIAGKNSLQRILRCCTIMGRKEGDELSAAQIMYPCMQCADVFYLKADICQLGMDQRKVNMLAREYCDSVKPKIKNKPVILSHHMMPGLKQGQEKMSKSNPESAIFMEDSENEVKTKIKKAFCPPNEVSGNPCLEYVKYLVFGKYGKMEIVVDGTVKCYEIYDILEEDYVKGVIHPGDLKTALAKSINEMLKPVREHFETNEDAKQLLSQVKKYRVTK